MLLTAMVAVPLTAVAAPYAGPSSTDATIHTLPSAGSFGGTAIGIAASGHVATTLAVWTGIGYPIPVPVPTATGTDYAITDINNSGTVAGWYFSPTTGQRRGFVWHPGDAAIRDVGNPGMVLEISGIDDDGRVVGKFTAGAGVCGATAGQCGFIVRPEADGSYGLIESIGAAPNGARFLPLDIGGGLVVSSAWTWDATASDEGARWQSLVDPLGGTLAQGVAVNEARQIAGHWIPDSGVTEALYWPGNTLEPLRLGVLGGDGMSQSHGIGENGIVAGWSSTSATGPRRAWIWNGATLVELGHIPGETATADAYDSHGDLVVGMASSRAVIWDLDGDFDIDYPPEIVVDTPIQASAGELVRVVPSITDFDGDTFTVACANLPPDAVCDTDGVITWQTDIGDVSTTPYAPTITATQDGVPANAHVVTVWIHVGAGVFLQPIGDQQVDAGELLAFIAVADGDARTTFSYSPALAGASIDASSGSFTWTPTLAQVGDHEITVTVQGGDTRTSDSETLTITVTDPGSTPDPISISLNETIGVGDLVTVQGPVVITVTEAIGVNDASVVRLPVIIRIGEVVGVADVATARPPVVITVGEAVGVSETVIIRGDAPVLISITESVGVADVATVRPPVVIRVIESIPVSDDITAARATVTVATILDYLATLDDADFRHGLSGRNLFERLLAGAERSLRTIDTLLLRVDGCGDAADRNDLIVNCDAQHEVRRLLMLLREQMTNEE
jgi:hypothetical protein